MPFVNYIIDQLIKLSNQLSFLSLPNGSWKYPATGHTYTSEVTTHPTCTTKGTITHTCSCGYSYTENISELGHVMLGTTGVEGKDYKTTAPTCINPGYNTYYCRFCNYSENKDSSGNLHDRVDALGHDVSGKSYQTDGSSHWKICNRCSKQVYYDNSTRAWTLGKDSHKAPSSGWTVDRNSTCSVYGSKHWDCTICSHRTTADIALISHNSNGASAYNTSYHVHGYCTMCGCEMKSQSVAGNEGHYQSWTQDGCRGPNNNWTIDAFCSCGYSWDTGVLRTGHHHYVYNNRSDRISNSVRKDYYNCSYCGREDWVAHSPMDGIQSSYDSYN